ncbi:MAG TPA: hypothetical protein VMX14_07170 [Anaerolineae bacterium]|nr:hypothetical protein [Anaerolineae bacterium]
MLQPWSGVPTGPTSPLIPFPARGEGLAVGYYGGVLERPAQKIEQPGLTRCLRLEASG